MVEWGSPAVEAHLALIHVDVLFLLLGVYAWEYLCSLDIEYALIQGRLTFRWPLVPYLVGRTALLTILLLLVIEINPLPAYLTCEAAITSSVLLGNIVLASSSANFMVRTWLIWKNSRLVHILLSFAALGHLTILAIDVGNVKAFSSDGTCAVYLVHPTLSTGIFVYTAFYDLLILILCIVKLSGQPSKSPLEVNLRSQGLFYVTISVIANILPTVFGFLGSPGMVNITSCFAVTMSTIVSCRAVRSLLGLRIPHSSQTSDESTEQGVALTTVIPIVQVASVA